MPLLPALDQLWLAVRAHAQLTTDPALPAPGAYQDRQRVPQSLHYAVPVARRGRFSLRLFGRQHRRGGLGPALIHYGVNAPLHGGSLSAHRQWITTTTPTTQAAISANINHSLRIQSFSFTFSTSPLVSLPTPQTPGGSAPLHASSSRALADKPDLGTCRNRAARIDTLSFSFSRVGNHNTHAGRQSPALLNVLRKRRRIEARCAHHGG